MSHPTIRHLSLVGGALLAVVALGACTSPYGERGPGLSPSPSLSASPDDDPSGHTRPTDDPTVNGGATVALGEVTRGVPDGIDEAGSVDAVGGVGWSSDGATLYVTTFGSSTCPGVASDIVAEDGTLTIEITMTGGAVCTMDYVPTTTAVPAPAGVPTAITQTAVLQDLGSVELAPAADPIAYAWVPANQG